MDNASTSCSVCNQARKAMRVICGACNKAVCWDTCCQKTQTPVGKNIEFTYRCASACQITA